MGDALASLDAADALASLPATAGALRRGELSFSQTKEITSAAVTQPREETALLKAAAEQTLKGLKERCAKVRATAGSADEENARYRRMHGRRFLRHWTDADGAFRLDARLTPEAGAQLVSAVEHEARAVFDYARSAQNHESPAAYAADALVALVTRNTKGRERTGRQSGTATVHVRVDYAALRRGHAQPGETCEIPGVGPVPVATAIKTLSDAFLKLFVTKGVDVHTVCHVGRTIPAHIQSALEERDPTCVVPGCDVAQGLENHHWGVPYAECGTSTLSGLARVCGWHHDLLSYEGYELQGGPGKGTLAPPNGATLLDTG
jgi:hypothetical protein